MNEDSIIETVEKVDVALSYGAGQARNHPVTRAAGFVSEISDQPPAFTLAAAAMVAGVVMDRRDLTEVGARSLIGLTIVTLTKSFIKSSVTRTRPFMMFEHGEYDRRVGGPDDGPWNSFPSGHTGNAVAVAAAVGHVYPRMAAPAALAAAAIGAVQVPRASHHALDVIAGAALGLTVDRLVTAVWPVDDAPDDTDARAQRGD